MSKIKVAIIGVGSMGKNHVRAYTALKNICDLKGVYDLDYSLAEKVASSYGIDVYKSIDSLMDEVDAVNIVTPTSTHYQLAKKAIEKDLHLLIEKPITSKIDEAEEVIELASKKKLILQVGHIERFNPAIRALPKILENEEIISVNAKRLGPYTKRINDTDVIQDLMIHDIDIINSIISSKTKEISAFGSKIYTDFIDYAKTALRTETGVIVDLEASRVTNKKVRELCITTKKSYIELNYIQRKIVINTEGSLFADGKGYHQDQQIEELYDTQEDALESQLTHFINCIKEKRCPLIDGNDALEALRISKEIQRLIYNK